MSYNQEPFLESNNEDWETYDPFESPPDFVKAQRHRRAAAVGIDSTDNNCQLCPCCENIIEKTALPLCCGSKDLLFLGVGYPLLLKLTQYVAAIILILFIISGSAFYFFITINCKDQCLSFFGLPIYNPDITPEQSAKKTQLFNVVTAIGILGFIIYIKSHLIDEIYQLQSQVICPSNYTIMLQNLPPDYTDAQLYEWLAERFEARAIGLNTAYNCEELSLAFKRRNELTIKVNKKRIQQMTEFRKQAGGQKESFRVTNGVLTKEIAELKSQIERQDLILQKFKEETVQCKKVGTVFVTFEERSTVERILGGYESSFMNSLICTLASVFRKSKLEFKGRVLVVQKAPAPREIMWDNLQFSYVRSILFELGFILVMVLLISGAFRLQFYFVSYAYGLRIEGKTSGKILVVAQALIMSLIVVVLNSLLRLVIQIFTHLKRYYSFTKYQASFCLYYSIFYVLNTCFMIYIVHGQYIEDSNELLLYDIHIIMVANAFSQPLFKIFDPIMWYRIAARYYVCKLEKQKNPYTQHYAHKLFQGHQISNGDNYQYVARVLFVVAWFAHAAPLGVVFSLLGLLADYWAGKYLLLRVYRRPENIGKDVGIPIINLLELVPLVYICGVLEFSYKVSSQNNLFTFLYNFLQYGITLTVILLCILGYIIFFSPKSMPASSVPYSKICLKFGYNYETENPITRYRGEINLLKNLLKNDTQEENDQEVVNDLMRMRQHSSRDYMVRKSQATKLKLKMLRKYSSIDMQMSNQIQLEDIAKRKLKEIDSD